MELLVIISGHDTVSGKPEQDAKKYRPGDVIAVREDGAEWGIEEVKNPNWRIIRVPGMTREEADALVSPELPPTLDKEYPLLRKRQMRIDVDALDSTAKGAISAAKNIEQVELAYFAVVQKRQELFDSTPGLLEKLAAYEATKQAVATEKAKPVKDKAAINVAVEAEFLAKVEFVELHKKQVVLHPKALALNAVLKQELAAKAVHAVVDLSETQKHVSLKTPLK